MVVGRDVLRMDSGVISRSSLPIVMSSEFVNLDFVWFSIDEYGWIRQVDPRESMNLVTTSPAR